MKVRRHSKDGGRYREAEILARSAVGSMYSERLDGDVVDIRFWTAGEDGHLVVMVAYLSPEEAEIMISALQREIAACRSRKATRVSP